MLHRYVLSDDRILVGAVLSHSWFQVRDDSFSMLSFRYPILHAQGIPDERFHNGKSNFMIVCSPRNLLLQFLYAFMPFSHGQSKVPFPHLKMRRPSPALSPFTRAFVQSVAEPGQDSRSASFPFCFCFLEENSRQSLLILPLEIFSFPPVKSEERRWLLSMETAQSVFNRNKSDDAVSVHIINHSCRESCMDFSPVLELRYTSA